MEIKDLAVAVDMADVRGGARAAFGNVQIRGVRSWNESTIYNGDVDADTRVYANRASGSSFDGIGAVVTYAPTNTVTQTSGNAFNVATALQGLNFSF